MIGPAPLPPSLLTFLLSPIPFPLLLASLRIPSFAEAGAGAGRSWKGGVGRAHDAPGSPVLQPRPCWPLTQPFAPLFVPSCFPRPGPLPTSLWTQGNSEGHIWEVCRDLPEKATSSAGAEDVWTSRKVLSLVQEAVWKMDGHKAVWVGRGWAGPGAAQPRARRLVRGRSVTPRPTASPENQTAGLRPGGGQVQLLLGSS